jgi:hypothetical protein
MFVTWCEEFHTLWCHDGFMKRRQLIRFYLMASLKKRLWMVILPAVILGTVAFVLTVPANQPSGHVFDGSLHHSWNSVVILFPPLGPG